MNKKAHNMKVHMVIGISIILALFYLNNLYSWYPLELDSSLIIQLAIIAAIYSLMPDVDQPGSIINKYITLALGGLAILSFMGYILSSVGILAVIVLILLRVIEHRTLIHSVLGAVIISSPLLYLGTIHFIVGFISFLSHIVSDNDFSFGWEKDHRLWGG